MSEQDVDQAGEQTGTKARPDGLADGGVPRDELPSDDQPGGESTPFDTEGAGSVTLEDRTRTDDKGAPATNQAKAEPIAPTSGHRDPNAPLTPPLLEDMNVGAADPQSPSHPAAASAAPSTGEVPRPSLGGAGSPPAAQRPVVDAGTSTGRATGPEQPLAASGGTSSRAPGTQGSPGPDEAVETDTDAGAREMSPAGPSSVPADGSAGDAAGVPVPSIHAGEGTSEEHATARGARTPDTGA
jgi:hypothetical protein